MVERTQKVLSQLHDLVAGAKGVPMSASCMISRADALALVEAISGKPVTRSLPIVGFRDAGASATARPFRRRSATASLILSAAKFRLLSGLCCAVMSILKVCCGENQISQATARRIFALADELDHFQGDWDFKKHRIAWIKGSARLAGAGLVEVTDGEAQMLHARKEIILATGSAA